MGTQRDRGQTWRWSEVATGLAVLCIVAATLAPVGWPGTTIGDRLRAVLPMHFVSDARTKVLESDLGFVPVPEQNGATRFRVLFTQGTRFTGFLGPTRRILEQTMEVEDNLRGLGPAPNAGEIRRRAVAELRLAHGFSEVKDGLVDHSGVRVEELCGWGYLTNTLLVVGVAWTLVGVPATAWRARHRHRRDDSSLLDSPGR